MTRNCSDETQQKKISRSYTGRKIKIALIKFNPDIPSQNHNYCQIFNPNIPDLAIATKSFMVNKGLNFI